MVPPGGDSDRYTVHDTHTSKLLSGTSPDITLVKKGLSLSAFNAVWVLELQVRCPQSLGPGQPIAYAGWANTL